MKTKFALLFIFLYSFFGASAQQPVIQNAGFETWNDSVPSYPVGWDSDGHLIHKQSALLRQKGWCVQDTTPANVVAGSASCRLRTDTVGVINTIIPGVVSYGSLGFNGTPYPIGVPFTGRPTVFSGSVKFIPNGADTAQFNLFLSKWDATGDSEIIIVLDNEIVLGTDSSFVTFSDTLHYLNSFTPDTIIIAFYYHSELSQLLLRITNLLFLVQKEKELKNLESSNQRRYLLYLFLLNESQVLEGQVVLKTTLAWPSTS